MALIAVYTHGVKAPSAETSTVDARLSTCVAICVLAASECWLYEVGGREL